MIGAAAQQLMKDGYNVIPLKSGEKIPAFKGWNVRGPYTRFEMQSYFRYKAYNIALDLRENLLVADCDTPAMLDEVFDIFGATPAAVKTSRGFHAIYRRMFPMKKRQHYLGKPVDLLVEMSVAPPSFISKTEFRYEWDKYAKPSDLPEIDQAKIQPEVKKEVPKITRDFGHVHDAKKIAFARTWLSERQSIQGSGTGDLNLFKAACGLIQWMKLDYQIAYSLLMDWNDCQPEPWPEPRIRYKLDQALKLMR